MVQRNNLIIGQEDLLVIIDAQNDFILEDGKLYVKGVPGESSNEVIVAGIKEVCKKFKRHVTTEDKHGTNHIEFGIFGEHCVVSTPGQKYITELLPVYDTADENIKKGNDSSIISYSIATSSQFSSHVRRLRFAEIRRIFLVGWAYTHCVGESAISYACQGFEVYVIEDLTRSVPPPYGDIEKMKKKLELYGVKEVFLKDIE
ncbi:MAG: hypothetical protein UT05_C0001G0054 [Parcubacteria group bacterium GW2011_GWF2_38_76]|nr:MAG: hypothetical protein UT05_C0001G0054 [Parcubacteria group bacterium GW2011_GWF2_38_76]HBM45969.1 hypothetical protein [Patescibacteria group bacterium]